MRWRPRPEAETGSWLAPYAHGSDEDPYQQRSAELAEVLARLEVATLLRDAAAAQRLLDRLGETDDGTWLLHQCAAAGLRAVAARISDAGPATPGAAPAGPPIPGIRTIGAA